MTLNDLLQLVLCAADDVGRIFDHAETRTWPSGSLDVMRRLRLLRPAATGLHAPCPNCAGDHIEPVSICNGPADAKRYFIWCAVAMRIEVAPEMCNGWEIDRDGLAATAAAALGITQTPRPVVPDRFWRLGRAHWPPGSSQTREVVLALRLRDADGPAIAAHVGPGGRAIVLVPHLAPDQRIWSDPRPAVVPLSEVMSLVQPGMDVDLSAIVEIVRSADDRTKTANAIALGSAGKKMVRRQVKAEMNSLLTDDAYIAAYTQHHSYRKAAEALTRQTGQRVSKDKVRRAVERKGGLAEVIPDGDSASVARSVASQPRDRAEKYLQRR